VNAARPAFVDNERCAAPLSRLGVARIGVAREHAGLNGA